ncbi:MAG: dodecin family protein [Candidatus Izemoplasmatales bacterium]
MGIVKVIEVIAKSTVGWEDASQNAIKEASKTIKNIKSIYIKEFKASVENDKIDEYIVIAKVSFLVED